MGRIDLLFSLSWRSLWRNPRRTVITILVVGVGLWSILVFAALLAAWSVSSRDTTIRTMTGEGEIHANGYADDPTVAHRMPPPAGALRRALESSGIAAHAERVRLSAIAQSEYKTRPITLAGVDPHAERTISDLPHDVSAGRYLASPDDPGIVLGRDLARRLKTRIGKRVVVMVQDTRGKLAERAFVVIGFYAASREAEDEFAFTGLRTAQSFAAMDTDISEIVFDAARGHALADVLDRLRAAAPGLDVQSWETIAPLAYAVSTFFNEFILIWLWVMFALIAIGIVNTQLMAVFERTQEFGLLEALGMRPRLVLAEVALESAMLIGVGILVGIGLSIVSIGAFPNGLDLGFLGRGAELVGAGRILYPRVDAGDFAFYSAIVWVLGVLVTLWPARRASKIDPVEAMSRA